MKPSVEKLMERLTQMFEDIVPTVRGHQGFHNKAKAPMLALLYSGQNLRKSPQRFKTLPNESLKQTIIIRKTHDILYHFQLVLLTKENADAIADSVIDRVIENRILTDENGNPLELSISPFEFDEEESKEGANKYRATLTVKGIIANSKAFSWITEYSDEVSYES
jgi:hypothetical protein